MPAVPRAAMEALIERVRALIGDPAGAAPLFDDGAIQDRLDRTRVVVRQGRPDPQQSFSTAGAVQWLDFQMEDGDWAATVVLQDLGYTDITSLATIDYQTGQATFTASQTPPIYWSGETYDCYAAAAALIDQLVLTGPALIDFSEDGQSLKRSQRWTQLQGLAASYRGQARVTVMGIGRSDAGGVG